MIEFGKTLKDAREAAGLSIQQIAERTHMMSAMIEDLENERFNRIVAPIYGRGFVKLYCEAVGLDPKPLVAEFMAIFTGTRSPTIRERVIVNTPAPTPEPEPTPIIEATQPEPEPAIEPEIAPAPIIEEAAPQPQFEPEPEFKLESDPPPKAPPQFTRYSAPLRDYTPDVDNIDNLSEIKMRILRLAILGVGGIVLLWIVCAGISALYHATSKPSEASTAQEVTEQQVSEPAPDIFNDKPLPRQPIVVPPLYID